MTRSEERMHVGTATEETGRVRLRKYIVTETVQQSVPVSHEEVRVEREPITEANIGQAMAGPEISQEEHEVTLHAERPGSPCTPGTEACPLAGAGLLLPAPHLVGDVADLVLCHAVHTAGSRGAHAQRPGPQGDVMDCQWIAELRGHGLLRPSFIPTGAVAELRSPDPVPQEADRAAHERGPGCEVTLLYFRAVLCAA